MNDPNAAPLWHLITRLGEAQIVLPVVLLSALALLSKPRGRSLAVWWIAWLALAVLVTTASKVAFIGWGFGWQKANFTGVSGHAMFAAAVYPLLLGLLASRRNPPGRRLIVAAIILGYAMAVLIGVSRIVLNTHSISEVLAGLLLGTIASVAALRCAGLPRTLVHPALPLIVALWLALTPGQAAASRTHSMVTRLSLALSGHKTPYTRGNLMSARRRG